MITPFSATSPMYGHTETRYSPTESTHHRRHARVQVPPPTNVPHRLLLLLLPLALRLHSTSSQPSFHAQPSTLRRSHDQHSVALSSHPSLSLQARLPSNCLAPDDHHSLQSTLTDLQAKRLSALQLYHVEKGKRIAEAARAAELAAKIDYLAMSHQSFGNHDSAHDRHSYIITTDFSSLRCARSASHAVRHPRRSRGTVSLCPT